MGQILFLEDQLDAGIIEHIFGSLINEQQRDLLRQSENDTVEIRKALGQNTSLQVHFDFSKAMSEIEERGLDVYDLIIVDRDLFDNGQKYRPEKIPGNMEPMFSEKYHRREGDYLIWYALRKKYDLDTRFYIFTGNTDDIRAQEGMEAMLSEKFLTENVIVKSVEGRDRLKEIVERREDLQVLSENRAYLDILSRAFGSKSTEVQKYLEIVREIPSKSAISLIRIVAESLIERLAKNFSLSQDCYNNYNNKPVPSAVIRHLTWENRDTDEYPNDPLMTPLIANYLHLVWHVCSGYGAHSSKFPTPKHDDMQVLFTALKSVILWFDKKMKRQTPRPVRHKPGLVSFGDVLGRLQ